MKQTGGNATNNTERILGGLSARQSAPTLGFVVLIALYLLATYFTTTTSISEDAIMLMGKPVPLRMLAGAFSGAGNLCIVLMVVFYRKPGFFVALGFLILSFFSLAFRLVAEGNPTVLAGFSTNVLTIVVVVLLYLNNLRIRNYQGKMHDLAVTDQLTGIPNRFACSEFMESLVQDGEPFAIASLRLNGVKSIGKTMGQHTMDLLLADIAQRWKDIADTRETDASDFLTCQAEGEFALVIRDCRSHEGIVSILARYESALEAGVTIEETDYYPTASIGYAVFPTDAKDVDSLLACANAAVVESRRINGDSHICRFTPELANAEHLIETERKIRAGLENGSVYFDLQPQYDISHRLSGFEALARLRDADGTTISPAEFIPVAEQVGLIDRIDYTVFRDAATFFGELIRKTGTDITLSVNVSVRHLMKNGFLDEVRGILDTCGVPANQLEIEITESIMIDSAEEALRCINAVKAMGIKIAIDDFGTGYSSLSYLNTFPADMLKVDKSFIDTMNDSDASRQYVAAIIMIGHVMDFVVISEGVEHPEQLETLRSIGCDYIQGFVWGRPMSPLAAEELVMQSM